MLKKERTVALKKKEKLQNKIDNGGYDKLAAYDLLISECIDILEDAGYLTKEIVMMFGDET